MQLLGIVEGQPPTRVEIDSSQAGTDPLILYDGPIEGYLHLDMGALDGGTNLYGKVWTGGPHVVIRYYEARPKFKDPLPVCLVLGLEDQKPLVKRPDSKPGIAYVSRPKAAYVYAVESFR
jgi:hypothetical protein